jgi:hypothetical protein
MKLYKHIYCDILILVTCYHWTVCNTCNLKRHNEFFFLRSWFSEFYMKQLSKTFNSLACPELVESGLHFHTTHILRLIILSSSHLYLGFFSCFLTICSADTGQHFLVPCVFGEEGKKYYSISVIEVQSQLLYGTMFSCFAYKTTFLNQPSVTTWKELVLKCKYCTY